MSRLSPSRLARLPIACLVVFAAGCLGVPDLTPYPARIARPLPSEIVRVEDSILVFDASGSIDRALEYPGEKAVLRSFVEGMPPGTYRSALRVLGGRDDDQLELEPFDRMDLRQRAAEVQWTGRETPLVEIFDHYREHIADRTGRAAFVIFSDGVPTRHGRPIAVDDTLAAARRIVERHPGPVCFHTVQVGHDPRSPELLAALAALSDCGSFRPIDDLDGGAPLLAFQRQIYHGPSPAAAPATPRAITDLDRDGVDDHFDRCPRTPFGAHVDPRGCWVIEDTVFEPGSAKIRPEQRSALEAVRQVLLANPGLRIRLDGHTDDTGTSDHNVRLSERRAAAIRADLEQSGVDVERIEVRGFGATRPIGDNATASGRQLNRRVEISVIDG